MNLSFKQYRTIDLAILAVLLVISEAVVTIAAAKWFAYMPFSLSTTLTMVCIVMMRWDKFAVIHAVIGGCVYCLASGATAEQFAVYCAGNCGVLLALVLFKIFGKQKVRDRFYLSLALVAVAYCGMQLGRWAVSLAFGGENADILMFLAGDGLTVFFAAMVVLIARRMDGLFEDQRTYLLRINEEERKAREAQEKENHLFYE